MNQQLPTWALDQNDFLKSRRADHDADPLNQIGHRKIPQMVSFSTLAQSQAMQTDIALLGRAGTLLVAL